MTNKDAIKIRNKTGLSRAEFARDVLCVSYSTVEKWERGDYSISAAGVALYRAVEFINRVGLIEEFKKTKALDITP